MNNKTLNYLLSHYFYNGYNIPSYEVLGIKIDSRLVVKGDLFIAIKGFKTDGRLYINEAVNKGAIAVLTFTSKNKSYFFFSFKYNIYIFFLFNLVFYLSNIIGDYYDHPSRKILSVGVTGTNGKTTIVYLLASWVYLLGYRSSLLSTVGNGIYPNLYYSENTTSSVLNIQFLLNNFYNLGSNFVSIEVSSHSLVQYRINFIFFSVVVFTNLTIDHLDYHKNMKNYELAKWKLFSEYNVRYYVINIDDKIGFSWICKLPKDKLITVSLYNSNVKYYSFNWIYLSKIESFGFIKKLYFKSSWGNGILKTSLISLFNIKNLLLSFSVLLSLGYNFNDLLYTSKFLLLPKGRMEFFYSKNKPLVIIDYAHTPDALKNIILISKKLCLGKLWCVFGCTGNRDRSKRSLMGKISQKLADIVVITNDDLYYEKEISILKDIKSGFYLLKNIYIILNRKLAIQFCIETANSKDIVLVCGKGHEIYQIILDKKISYSDSKSVSKILGINYV